MDCLFCKIINNIIPSYTIYEDEKVKVFLDINPSADGHMLIVPKKHYQDIMDIDNDLLVYMFEVGRKMYKLVIKTLNTDGITFVQNNGSKQDIKHFHIHLVPKSSNSMTLEEVYKKLKEDKK